MNVPTGWPDNYVLEDSLKVENKTAKRKRKEGADGKRKRAQRGERETDRQQTSRIPAQEHK